MLFKHKYQRLLAVMWYLTARHYSIIKMSNQRLLCLTSAQSTHCIDQIHLSWVYAFSVPQFKRIFHWHETTLRRHKDALYQKIPDANTVTKYCNTRIPRYYVTSSLVSFTQLLQNSQNSKENKFIGKIYAADCNAVQTTIEDIFRLSETAARRWLFVAPCINSFTYSLTY